MSCIHEPVRTPFRPPGNYPDKFRDWHRARNTTHIHMRVLVHSWCCRGAHWDTDAGASRVCRSADLLQSSPCQVVLDVAAAGAESLCHCSHGNLVDLMGEQSRRKWNHACCFSCPALAEPQGPKVCAAARGCTSRLLGIRELLVRSL